LIWLDKRLNKSFLTAKRMAGRSN